jgi:hypothetical protein
MLLGQSILAPTTAATYYGPWMPRGGDAFTAVLEVMRTMGGAFTLIVEIETKNREDADTAVSSLGTMSTNGTGTIQKHFSGCKELVRCKYTATGTSAIQWLHVRMNHPIWQPN